MQTVKIVMSDGRLKEWIVDTNNPESVRSTMLELEDAWSDVSSDLAQIESAMSSLLHKKGDAR